MQTVLHSAGRCAIGTIQFVPKAFLEVTKVTMSRKYLINPLTVVPESHTGNDHALFDLFHVYFSASLQKTPVSNQQDIIYLEICHE